MAGIFAPAAAQSINGCVVAIAAECPNADLRNADLRGRLASRANFAHADLRQANLEGIVLWKTNFSGANLEGAKLNDAFLTGADLRGANLSKADLSNAFLFQAFTQGANFEGARLDGARWVTGEICGPGSTGSCRPLPATAAIPIPAAPAPHDSPSAQSPTPPAAAQFGAPTELKQLMNKSHGVITRVLPAEMPKALPTDGASFAGFPFVVRDGSSTISIHVTAQVFADEPNEAVIAVFRDSQAPPIKLVTKKIAAKRMVRVEFEFDVAAGGANLVNLDFRIGPARAGAVILNGPEAANSNTSAVSQITIKEAH